MTNWNERFEIVRDREMFRTVKCSPKINSGNSRLLLSGLRDFMRLKYIRTYAPKKKKKKNQSFTYPKGPTWILSAGYGCARCVRIVFINLPIHYTPGKRHLVKCLWTGYTHTHTLHTHTHIIRIHRSLGVSVYAYKLHHTYIREMCVFGGGGVRVREREWEKERGVT